MYDIFTAISACIRIHQVLSFTNCDITSSLNSPIMAQPNGYGVINNLTAGNRLNANESTDEHQPLFRALVLKSGWRKRMVVGVNRDKADAILLMCYIITGILDSASISAWGSFVSMQTGLF
jgi:hypothetical protein